MQLSSIRIHNHSWGARYIYLCGRVDICDVTGAVVLKIQLYLGYKLLCLCEVARE